MNLASLLVNAVFTKLFHGWVKIQSLKSSNEHTEWNKAEAFGRLPCRARGGGKGPGSLGQGLILSCRFGISNIAYEEVLQPCLSLTLTKIEGSWSINFYAELLLIFFKILHITQMARVTGAVITREIFVGISVESLAVNPSYRTCGLKFRNSLTNAVVFKEWRHHSLYSVLCICMHQTYLSLYILKMSF